MKERSGGQFHEQVTHTVDLVRFLCGEVREVYALPAKGFSENAPPSYNVEDAVAVNMRLVNGAVGSLWRSDVKLYANRTTALFTGWEHRLRLLRSSMEPKENPTYSR